MGSMMRRLANLSILPAAVARLKESLRQRKHQQGPQSGETERKKEVKVQSEWSLCMEHAILSPNWTFKKLT